MDPSQVSQVKHLYAVEGLTMRQIALEMKMCHKTVSRIITGKERPKPVHKPTVLAPYLGLIAEWYGKRPSLKATQVYERLKEYGYPGRYTTVSAYTRAFRKKQRPAFHALEFVPGACAQVDWMEATLPFGKVYGFVFVLAWSRYLFVRFYPRSSMEFFLDGHREAYTELGGAARENWYDNLKSVVISRKPELALNATFVDFMRHMGVAIHACTPGRANEKGRVERPIRDIRSFMEAETCADMGDLNRKADRWRRQRNERIHRATHRTPAAMLREEPLLPLPALPYRCCRIIPAVISTTAFVEFETNRYSVPTDYAGRAATICAAADRVEIVVHDRIIARHGRSFGRYEKIEHPAHREKLLDRTPHGKYERIECLMRRMGKEVEAFLSFAEAEGDDRFRVAYGLFRLLVRSSKEMLLSAVREAQTLHIYKLRYIEGLLGPGDPDPAAVYPQNASLLEISYTTRELADYDDLTRTGKTL